MKNMHYYIWVTCSCKSNFVEYKFFKYSEDKKIDMKVVLNIYTFSHQ